QAARAARTDARAARRPVHDPAGRPRLTAPAAAVAGIARLSRACFVEYRALVLAALSPRARVGSDLDAVTRIRWEAEAAPREVGVESDARDRIWHAARRLYQSGIHPALAL